MENKLTVTQPISPMEMIQKAFESAIEKGAGLEVVDRILAQQREMMKYQDSAAFNAALQRLQSKLKPIVKDCENKETHSRYASAEAVDSAIESLLMDERMTLSFVPRPIDKPDMVCIVGVLSLGAYSKEYPLEMPADGKGAKGGGVMSRTHATGSAISYAKRYLKNMIFNLRYKEKDDDGNRAGGGAQMDEVALREWLDVIRCAESIQELQKQYIAALKIAAKIGDTRAAEEIESAKDKRRGELGR